MPGAPWKLKTILSRAGLLAGLGLILIYAGLIVAGATYAGDSAILERTQLLTLMSRDTLGGIGSSALAVLVALACFTTAVGIVTGTADFVKGLLGKSHIAYVITVVLASLAGIIVGRLDVHYIIDVAVPVLMLAYPLTIILILLNVLPERWASPLVFKVVSGVTLLFGIPDLLASMGYAETIAPVVSLIPFAEAHMGWLLPAAIAFVLSNLIQSAQKTSVH